MYSRENPSAGQGTVGLMRGLPAINKQLQCILGEVMISQLKIEEVYRLVLAEWA